MPGAALIAMGLLIWLFLVVEPEEAGLFKMRDSILVSTAALRLLPSVRSQHGCKKVGLPSICHPMATAVPCQGSAGCGLLGMTRLYKRTN